MIEPKNRYLRHEILEINIETDEGKSEKMTINSLHLGNIFPGNPHLLEIKTPKQP
jgi:hypothetical protein